MRALPLLAVLALPGLAPAQGANKLMTYLQSLPLEALSATEKAGLAHLRQEEKLARDVYQALNWFWKSPIFANIASSEQQHMDLVKWLLDRYGIADPLPGDGIGLYRDPIFTQLFILLVTFGAQSLDNALMVGAFIEDLDIADLMAEIAHTNNRDINTVWQNLAKGSRNHLRSFYAQLVARNVVYKPLVLSPALFNQIVSSPHETAVAYDENGLPL